MKNVKLTTTIRLSSLMVMSVLSYCACTNIQDESLLIPESEKIPVLISTQIQQVHVNSRMVENRFEVDDSIGLYILKEPELLNGSRHVENMKFTCTPSGFTPKEEIYYPYGECKCDFISYYPYQEDGFIEETSNIQVITKANQSLLASYSTSDFMIARTNGVSPSKSAVNLEHNRKLCQLNIIINLTGGDDITELAQNALITIDNVNTQAVYNLETDQINSLSNLQNITPYGEWKVNSENRKLTGMKAIIIPQPTTDCKLTLRVKDRTFISELPKSLNLTPSTSYELKINYNSIIGINGIIPTINDWNSGGEHESTFEEEENTTSVSISSLNFQQTNIYSFIDEKGTVIGELCKEYLLNKDINAQAIVLYPADDKGTGTVLQILNEGLPLHGGTVTWDQTTNSFDYTPGSLPAITYVYADKSGNFLFTKSEEELQKISLKANVLTDSRTGNIKTYPIVKIGTQYWMRENLSATKYNDNTPLSNNSSDLGTTTAGYYINNNNFFYNKASIITGKIAPKEWKIPNLTEWDNLKKYVNNKAACLKAGTWKESSSIAKANNISNFNGIPVGMFYSSNSPSVFKALNEKAIYWCLGSSPTTLTENCVLLDFSFDEVKNITHSDYCAYSVRCIKE